MYFLLIVEAILIVAYAAYLIKKTIEKEKIKKILKKDYTRSCSNCKYRDRSKLPYGFIYCKDGFLYNGNYSCNMHEFDYETKAAAECKYYLNRKRGIR